MASDLIGALRNRIFSLIDSIQPPSRYKALIVDDHVKRIFDHVLEEHELLDRNVSSIQIIDQRRATEQYLEAIYILKPNRYNAECLAADYIRAPARYSGAHVFFLPQISEQLALKVRNSATGRYLRTLKTAYIDFWPIESQIFSLDDVNSIETFYGKSCLDLVDRHATHTANQLVSLCTSLNEYPVIRFFSPKHPESFQPKMLSYMIADKFQKALDKYVRDFPDFEPADVSGRPRSVFLIVDRPIDQFVPLLHDFTFQALSYDLLPIRDGVHVDYEVERPEGGKEKVHGIIEEKDAEWVGMRHQHMRDVTEILSAKIEKLRRENPHFADQNSKTSVRDLQDMVAALPGFMKTRDRFALIVYMATECMNILEKKQLIDLADIEQTLSLAGIGPDGKKSKTLLDDFIAVLVENSTMTNSDKVRLILIYILYRKDGIIEQDLDKLIKHAGLTSVDADVIRNYQLLGAPIIKESLDKGHSLRPGNLHINTNQGLYNGRSSLNENSKLHKDTVYYNTFHTHSSEDVYSVSRYVPGLKNIAERLIRGTLNSQLFQFTKDDPLDHDNDSDYAHASLRNPRQRAAWAKTSNFQALKQRVFVFVVGGLTQAEARTAYELNKQYPKEVIFGGSTILTPGSFLRSLARLSVPRDRLGLEADARTKPVPSFLMESDRDTSKHNKATPALVAEKPLPAPISKLPMASNGDSIQSLTKEKEKKKKNKFKLFK